MLHELTITDFAIIQQVRLKLAPGLVIFTGETGAGKSIVLDAIGGLLGDRLGADMIRAGAPRAVVEGVFVLPWMPVILAEMADKDGATAEEKATPDEDGAGRPDPHRELARLLREHGLEGDDDTLIITREVAISGRSTARVNGRAVPLGVLARLGALLVDVHGQGAHLELLRSEQHVNYLDRYAETLVPRQELAREVRAWQGLKRELQSLRTDERELARRAELLRYQAEEIEGARLEPDEIAALEHERTVLANAERLHETSELAHAALSGDESGETPGALALIATAQHALRDLVRLDPSLEETRAAMDDAIFRLEDVMAALRDYRDAAEADPERLAEIEDRLDRITRLRRKYGATVDEVLAFAAQARAELEGIEHRDERIASLEARIERERTALGAAAHRLSGQRHAAATRMAVAMEEALETLSMRRARFVVDLATQPHADGVPIPGTDGAEQRIAITATGVDRVEFLIAPNPGEPPRPLARIASGGETARLMLALKSILAAADTTPILIFDEVDAGISGLTGQIVGEMLWRLGHAHQVICVTHLPQIAAFADQHWHVAKRIADDRTSTIVTELDAPGRTLELAQMLGGLATETAARNAAELLDRAAALKQDASPAPLASANGHASAEPASNGARRGGKKRSTRER